MSARYSPTQVLSRVTARPPRRSGGHKARRVQPDISVHPSQPAFEFSKPFFPCNVDLLSEAFANLAAGKIDSLRSGHAAALVLELLVTRRLLNQVCPHPIVSGDLSELIDAVTHA